MFCAKCGKEINEDSRFCTSCGCAIRRSNVSPTSGSPTVAASRRKIRTSWIVIGIVAVILIIAILVDRNSPENKAARKMPEKTKTTEKPVSWNDIKKSWLEAKKAKQDLDKSIDGLKHEWDGLKRQVKDVVNGTDADGGSQKVDHDVTVDEPKSAVRKSKAVIERTLDDTDLQNAAKELKDALKN